MKIRAWMIGVGLALSLSLPACAKPIPGDSDGDGIPDWMDPCPKDPNPACTPDPEPTACWDCDNPPAVSGFVRVEDPIPYDYIVVLNPMPAGESISPAGFAAKFKGLSNIRSYSRGLNGFAATIMDLKVVGRLLDDERVKYVVQNGRKKVSTPWHLDRSDQRELPLNDLYNPAQDGSNVAIYVLDTGCPSTDLKGCRQDHPEFGPRLQYESHSTILYQGVLDAHGHGSFVEAETAGVKYGIAKGAKVYSCRFLDSNGSGDDAGAVECIDWVIAHDPGLGFRKVMSNSWGGGGSPAVDTAICRARASGVVISNAAGNSSEDSCNGSPARVMQTFTVGASDRSDNFAYFSSYGKNVDLTAPGVDVESTTPSGGSTTMSGTSMATPLVAGAAALYLQRHPSATPDEIVAGVVMESTPDKLKGLPSDTPNRLLYVQPKSDGGVLPPKGELVGEEMILRTDYDTLLTVTGTQVKLNQQIQCCQSLYSYSPAVPRPMPLRVRGVEINTLWPCQSEEAQDYFREKGRSNAYACRGGPFRTDESAEVDWNSIGGPYLLGPNGEWTPEWNPAHWQKKREIAWHALQNGMWHFEVVIDTWGCKYDQNLGDARHYMLWPVDAIEACGRTWHPEHARYIAKQVEELVCFGNIAWELDNEGQGVHGWKAEWFQKVLTTIKEEEIKYPCRQRITGTSVPNVGADYRITHDRAPLTQPINGQWTLNNERNPAYPPSVDTQYFIGAGPLGWSLWRDGWTDAELEDALARRKAVVDGTPLPTSCPKPLAPGSRVYLNNNGYGHGFDSTVRVSGDPEFCQMIHGTPVNDCHLEGWPQRSACEMELMGGCPIWQCRTSSYPDPMQCLQPAHPICSCDHWGTAGGAQDDPHTDAYEGLPYECSYQQDGGFPSAGFYTVARGKGDVRACKPDGTGCGPWRFFDRAIDGE